MKQRMAIERKYGRVSFVFFLLSIIGSAVFVVQYLDFKPDAKRFNLSISLHVEA